MLRSTGAVGLPTASGPGAKRHGWDLIRVC
jgi:hypothetical protein